MNETHDWLWEVLACPECNGKVEPGPDEHTVSCVEQKCGYRSRRDGRLFNLLPRHLDQHQAAEHDFRVDVWEHYANSVRWMASDDLARFQLLNILTYYPFYSQFIFFREYFAKNHRLEGRGLEIGGATGETSGFIKLFYPETEIITSDVASINVSYAAQLADLLHFKTDYFVMADAERLPFRPDSFDFILSSGMLHHLGDIRRGLRKGYQVLKHGGRWYVIGELAIGSLFRLLWNSRWGGKGRDARVRGVRENSYTWQEWKASFQAENLKIVDYYFHRDPKTAASWPFAAYYAIISRLPINLVKMGVPCNVNFVLEKV